MERVSSALSRLEAYVQSQRNEVRRPGRLWRPVLGRNITAFMIQEVFPISFRKEGRVTIEMEWKDDTDPDDMR